MEIVLFCLREQRLTMKSRRKKKTLARDGRRTRLKCERLEPRLMLAGDDLSDVSDLLDALDSLTFTTSDDSSEDDSSDITLANNPGSLAVYSDVMDTSLATAGDGASVDQAQTPEPRHNA